MPVSASVTPATARISASTFSNRSRFCSTDVANGSVLNGVVHSATAAGSGASRTSSFFTRADARAISTASRAAASSAARLRWADAAKPHAPSAITRTPMPSDSDSEAWPTCPFLVVSERLRIETTRASAYVTPPTDAASNANWATAFMLGSNVSRAVEDFDLVEQSRSVHAGRRRGQRTSLARNVDQKAAGLQVVSIRLRSVFVHAAGIGPQAAHFHFARAPRHLRRQAPLLVHVGLDHLGRQTRRQFAVLAAFEEHANNNVRIASGRESHKPSVLSELFVVLMLCPQRQRDNLRRPGLTRDIDSRNVR